MMRLLGFSIMAVSLSFSSASAWERKTVGSEIEKMCEARNPSDWPRQARCIDATWTALKEFSPPAANGDPELVAIYDQCVAASDSEYDFSFIAACYTPKAVEYGFDSAFKKGKIVARCAFEGMPDIEIRGDGGEGEFPIMVRVGKGVPTTGRAWASATTFVWGGPQHSDFRIDGDQLMDRSGAKAVKIVAGKCERP